MANKIANIPKHIPFEFVTHQMRVKRLYKKIIRDIQCWNLDRYKFRIQAVLMRQKFDENKNVRDPIKAKQLVEEAEAKFIYIRHPLEFTFSTSYGGPAYERSESKPNDMILDYWHPLEKEQYPDYFARREQRKKEFVEWYDKTYGRPKYESVE